VNNAGNKSETAAIIRRKVEELLIKRPLKSPSEFSGADALKLIHELDVYQVELQMQNEELNLKNEELTKLNIEKDKFFSIIAHDLRSPFNNLLGLTEMMVRELPDLSVDKMQELAVNMKNSAAGLFRLLENLLQWSRMQQGLVPFNPLLIKLLPLVDESIETVMESVKSKRLDLIYDIPYDFEVYADSNMLKTVIRNLFSNAVKFTPKGGRILLSAKSNSEESAEISISDTGIGMSHAMIDNLFRIDVQCNREGTEGESSTGLGLIICRDFIGKHGGRLWVVSEEGNGSDFKFTLPHSALKYLHTGMMENIHLL
jgi:signal transduction histidine kinase